MGEEREEERGGRRKGDSGEELKEKGPAKKVDFFFVGSRVYSWTLLQCWFEVPCRADCWIGV